MPSLRDREHSHRLRGPLLRLGKPARTCSEVSAHPRKRRARRSRAVKEHQGNTDELESRKVRKTLQELSSRKAL